MLNGRRLGGAKLSKAEEMVAEANETAERVKSDADGTPRRLADCHRGEKSAALAAEAKRWLLTHCDTAKLLPLRKLRRKGSTNLRRRRSGKKTHGSEARRS